MLTFDEPTHTYRWKGVVVPSVTQILSDLMDWSNVPADTLEKAQLRGSNVHLMCQWYDEDRLDLEEFTPEEQGYLPGWQAFLADYGANWLRIETMDYHQRLSYAGTPDRNGTLAKLPGEWTVDIKTGEIHPLQGLQTAAYDKLVAPGGPPGRRATVHLRANGTYLFREWPDPNDWPTFASLLNVRSWTRKHL